MIKILLVDDDFLVRTFLSQLTDWESHGYTLVGTAQDGEEALEMVQQHQPDIIITDISMPVMDGIELIRQLKQRYPEGRVIALSCHDDFEYVKEAMRLGADEYVLKNLLTENSLLKVLESIRKTIEAPSDKLVFHNSDQEREHYLKLLNGEDIIEEHDSSFVVSAAMAIDISDYLKHIAKMSLEQQKKFHTSFTQICKEACENQIPVRCIHVREKHYALLMDLHTISSVYEWQQQIQRNAAAIVRYAERYLAVNIKIGTSKAANIQNKPQVYWLEAVDALNEQFYAHQSIFYGWQISACGKELPKAAQEFKEQIVKWVEQRDSGTIRRMWSKALAEFQAEHTQTSLVQEWVYQIDCMVGVSPNDSPDFFEQLDGLELRYLTFQEELLIDTAQFSNPVRQTIHYLQKNYQRNISLNEAAEEVHLNAAYLSHVFRKETGVTFSEYLLSCRINKAKALLIQTNEKVKEVGFQSGFNDYRNFCKMFKKITGMPPQNYRKQYTET